MVDSLLPAGYSRRRIRGRDGEVGVVVRGNLCVSGSDRQAELTQSEVKRRVCGLE